MSQERKAILVLGVALAVIVVLVVLYGGRERPGALTQERLITVKSAVLAYARTHGEPPGALTDLQLDAETLRDHIGEPFHYEIDGATITITSYGADRAPGGFLFKRDYQVSCTLTAPGTGDK